MATATQNDQSTAGAAGSDVPVRTLGDGKVAYDVLRYIPEESAEHYRLAPLAVARGRRDPLLDLVMSRLPKFERMDKPVEYSLGQIVHDPHDGKTYQVPALQYGKELIPLLAKPDTCKSDYSAFKEYKTSVRNWTQKMVDDSGQITFYATAIWLATGKVPQDIELVCATTEYGEDGSLQVTGDIFTFPTKRTLVDIIKMTTRIKKAWAGIKSICEKELL